MVPFKQPYGRLLFTLSITLFPVLLITSFIPASGSSSFSISGKVTEQDGRPLANVLLQACDLNQQPLLLIPGGEGLDSLTEDTDGLANLYQWLRADGYLQGCNLFWADGISAYNTREQNRTAVQKDLRAAYEQLSTINPDWDGHFDIIGHSFGGLIGRFYLESPTYEADRQYGIHIDNLITLGTPHGGSRVPEEVYPGALFIIGEQIFDPQGFEEYLAIAQLTSPLMDLYNFTHRQPDDVRYYLLGGDFLQQADVPIAVRLLYLPFAAFPGDIGVSQRSAGELAGNPGLKERYPHVCLLLNQDMHGYSESFGLGVLRSYVRPVATYLETIKPVLGSRSQDCPAQSSQFAEENGQETAVPFQAPAVVTRGSLPAGGAASGSFTLAKSGPTLLYSSWQGGGLDFILTDPHGRTIDPKTAVKDPQIFYEQIGGTASGLATYFLQDAARGQWQYTVSASSGSAVTAFSITAAALTNNPFVESFVRDLAVNPDTHTSFLNRQESIFKLGLDAHLRGPDKQDSPFETTSDGQGNYAFNGLAAGKYQVIPSLDGAAFSPQTAVITLPPARSDVNFVRQSGPPLQEKIYLPMVLTE